MQFQPPMAATVPWRSHMGAGASSEASTATRRPACSGVTGLGVDFRSKGLDCTCTRRRSRDGVVPSLPVKQRSGTEAIGAVLEGIPSWRAQIWNEPPPESQTASYGPAVPMSASAVARPKRASYSCESMVIAIPVLADIWSRNARPFGAVRKTSVAMPLASVAPSSRALATSAWTSSSPLSWMPLDSDPP